MAVLVIETWAYWLFVGALALQAVAAFAETSLKRKESAAIKENAELRDAAQRRESWLRKAKLQAGYDNNVSFDVVWNDTLEKARGSAVETPNVEITGRKKRSFLRSG